MSEDNYAELQSKHEEALHDVDDAYEELERLQIEAAAAADGYEIRIQDMASEHEDEIRYLKDDHENGIQRLEDQMSEMENTYENRLRQAESETNLAVERMYETKTAISEIVANLPSDELNCLLFNLDDEHALGFVRNEAEHRQTATVPAAT